MMAKLKNLGVAVLGATLLCSCGQSPLDSLGDPAAIPGNLGLPVQAVGGLTPNLTSRSSWQFSGTAVPVAPANGLIADISGSTVTILHSSRIATRFTGVTNPTVRAGDYVLSGGALSNVNFFGNSFTFSVLLDGAAVCPSSYLAPSVWAQIASFAANVCTTD
jgi:hypothetical protein